MPVYDNITQTMGRTPLVRLRRVTEGCHAEIYTKLEFFNPLSSVKDRIGVSMIDDAESRGLLHPESLLIEPTSGNTGIALAFVAASRGLRLKLVMPDNYSQERIVLFRALSAEIELTPGHLGMQGAVDRARELVETNADAIMLQQFENPANPAVHERTTAQEIWSDTEGKVDAFVAGVGTGGTITGVTRGLQAHKANIQAFAVEPAESPVISGGPPGPHDIQGIGAGFVPKNLDTELLTGIVRISTEEAFAMARRLASEEGILAGISSGANVQAALKVANMPHMRGRRIVTVCCSSGERYLSTALFAHLSEG
ncbi:MAG: cysteine synthase A [Myxococcales bacterium]|nr:cysteine synthase A [Myxococcales bacterium]